MPTVLILGASSDMALAIAREYASKGNNIQLAARNITRLTAAQSDLKIRSGVECSLHEFDASRFDTHPSFFNPYR